MYVKSEMYVRKVLKCLIKRKKIYIYMHIKHQSKYVVGHRSSNLNLFCLTGHHNTFHDRSIHPSKFLLFLSLIYLFYNLCFCCKVVTPSHMLFNISSTMVLSHGLKGTSLFFFHRTLLWMSTDFLLYNIMLQSV